MTLIAIGGAEDKTGEMVVLKRVLQEAKGAQSRVHVITTATSVPEETRKRYEDAFRLLGVECVVTHVATREEANDPQVVARISDADVIFFSGGDQFRLTTVLGGTAFFHEVERLASEGAVIAGTSAGAAAASSLMIYGGGDTGSQGRVSSFVHGLLDKVIPHHKQDAPAPDSDAAAAAAGMAMKKGAVRLTSGFGFVPNAVFDTHFLKRNRLARLFNAVATNPANIGIGLDENTAAVIAEKDVLEVVGSGFVTIVDGAGQNDVGKFITHKLAAGARYNLKERKVL